LADTAVGGSFTEQLATLKERAEAAAARASAARMAFRSESYTAAREVTADLLAYGDAIRFRKPEATPIAERPARERELTTAFLAAVEERGLVVSVLGNGGGVELRDPDLQRELDEAEAESRAADKAVRACEREHMADLEVERKRMDAERIKTALSGDDGDAIREVLNPTQTGAAAFTTDDIHRRHRAV